MPSKDELDRGVHHAIARLRGDVIFVVTDLQLATYLLGVSGVAGVILPQKSQELLERFPERVGWIDSPSAEFKLPTKGACAAAGLCIEPDLRFLIIRQLRKLGVRRLGFYDLREKRFQLRSIWAVAAQRVLMVLAERTTAGRVAWEICEKTISDWTKRARLSETRDAAFYEFMLTWLDDQTSARSLSREMFDDDHAMLVAGKLGPENLKQQLACSIMGPTSDIVKLSVAIDDPTKSERRSKCQFRDAELRMINVPERDIIALLEPFRSVAVELGERLGPYHQFATDLARYLSLFVAERPGLVHARVDWPDIVAGIAAVIAGVPRIVLSGFSKTSVLDRRMQPVLRAGYRHLLTHPNVKILNAGQNRASAEATEADEHREQLHIPKSAPVVGSICRFMPEDRLDVWISTAVILASQQPALHFLLAGEGPHRDITLASGRAAGLGDRLIIQERLTDPQHAFLLMDCFLSTSFRDDLFPMLIVAHLSGLPVVASAGKGFEDALHPSGISGCLVDSDEPDDYARAVVTLLADKDMAKPRLTSLAD